MTLILILHNLSIAATFKSREDHRKQLELEEARKAGLAPAEVDEDGKEINPHIPQYMSSAPWYLNAERPQCQLLAAHFYPGMLHEWTHFLHKLLNQD